MIRSHLQPASQGDAPWAPPANPEEGPNSKHRAESARQTQVTHESGEEEL